VGPGCLRVVDALWSAPNRTLTRAELLECLQMSRASLWRNVSKLEEVGLVERLDQHTVHLLEDWAATADTLGAGRHSKRFE
jgi:predicted transcriptional regulator